MNQELQQLKDIHLPHAISTWPTAPGWVILIALLTMTIGYLIYRYYQRRRSLYTVKFALSVLDKLKSLSVSNPENINIAAQISTLIRRNALHYFRREDIAGLSGHAWLTFLNISGNTNDFTAETGQLLITAAYRKENPDDLSSLFDLAQRWLATIAKQKSIGK
jgi:hypothetical protein